MDSPVCSWNCRGGVDQKWVLPNPSAGNSENPAMIGLMILTINRLHIICTSSISSSKGTEVYIFQLFGEGVGGDGTFG